MIRINKANHNGKYHNITGKYFCIYPRKYTGQYQPEYKSKLEYKMMLYLDKNPNIIQWGYESFPIKYLDLSSNPPKVRNYYIDFFAIAKTPYGLKKLWIEIKSERETRKPRSKNSMEYTTWVKNCCKWKAAEKLAKEKGCTFQIITENQLD